MLHAKQRNALRPAPCQASPAWVSLGAGRSFKGPDMCQSCEALMINGVHCHETGCPDAWQDYLRECDHCGCDFRPAERYQRYCSPCCAASAVGMDCDCVDCEDFRAEMAHDEN